MSDWAIQDNRRMLHAVYRIGNLDETRAFYKDALGMKELRYRDIKEEKAVNAFYGYKPEDTNFSLEVAYNYGVDKYDLGEGFGHFGLAVNDVAATVEAVRAAGGKVAREAGPVKGGKTVIAFVEDPTGYKWELIERQGEIEEPLAQVMLRVSNLERSIKYYTECLGMKLLRTRDNPEYQYTLAFLGYTDEDKGTVFELTYNYGRENYTKGDAYAQVAIGTDDVYKTTEQIRNAGGTIAMEPKLVLGTTKVMATTDPDGWRVAFVDNQDLLNELKNA